jgi:hypothetical protein
MEPHVTRTSVLACATLLSVLSAPCLAQSAPAAQAMPGTVAAGARVVLRLDQTLDSAKTPAGQSFTATLEADLAGESGQTVVPTGTKVMGKIVAAKQARRLAGKSELEVAFTDVRLNGRLFPIQTQGLQAAGSSNTAKTAKMVAAGAVIGTAAGGGSAKGAGKGAAVGATAALLTKGSRVQIPGGTLLELQLTAPLVIPPAAPPAAAPVAAAPVAVAPAPVAVAPAAAAKPASAAKPPASDSSKDCIKKLMAQGFSADEAIHTCGG